MCLTPTPPFILLVFEPSAYHRCPWEWGDGQEGRRDPVIHSGALTDLFFSHRLETNTSISLWGNQVREERNYVSEVCVTWREWLLNVSLSQLWNTGIF